MPKKRIIPGPRLLVVDIETMANLAWVWDTWDQNISPAMVVKHKRTICFAAKWLGEEGVEFHSEWRDSRRGMVLRAWELLDLADAIVGYNSKRFDVRHLNWEFMKEGLVPPSHFQHIDLYSVAKRELAVGSYKLEQVARRLGLGEKKKHEGWGLWEKVEAGDVRARRRMREYNIQDVLLTERLFERFRPWVPLRGVQSQKQIRGLLACDEG